MKERNLRLAGTGGVGLALGQILVWILEMFLADPVPGDVGMAIGSVLTAVVHIFVRRKDDEASSIDDHTGP